LYKNTDPKPDGFANLGLARADEVKKLLIRKGIAANSIRTKAKASNNLDVFNNKIIGGVNFLVGADRQPVVQNTPVKKEPEQPKKDGLLAKALDFGKATAASFKSGQRIELKNVQFDSGSSRLRNTSFTDLDKLVGIMNDNQKISIEIGGHTDNTGALSVNNRLSDERARRVRDYLVSKGIKANRLQRIRSKPACCQ